MASRTGAGAKPNNGSEPANTDKTESVQMLIRALEHGARENPKLRAVWEMVQRAGTAAGKVVKGTSSQRSFNVEFTNLCQTSLSSLGELEDAAFEVANPGRRAWDARSDEVASIGDSDLLFALSQHVATQSASALTAQYLERIAASAAQKAARQNRKRERPASPQASRAQGAIGGGRSTQRTESRRTADGSSLSAPDDSALGLLDESATSRAALEQLLTSRDPDKSAAVGGVRGTPADVSSVPLPPGAFLSKPKGGGPAKVIDLTKPSVRLSLVTEFSQRLQPWLRPVARYTGLAIDRVAPEKDRRHHHHHAHAPASSASGKPLADGTPLAALDVCKAQTPHDLLQLWEARESTLALLRSTLPGMATPATAPATLSAPPAPAPAVSGARTTSPPRSGEDVPAVDVGEAHTEEEPGKFFVNRTRSVSAAVPKSVVAGQVHFGVWKLEFPRYSQS